MMSKCLFLLLFVVGMAYCALVDSPISNVKNDKIHKRTSLVYYLCFMIIREKINIQDDSLISGLSPLVKLMNMVLQSRDKEIIIDFSQTAFVSPVFVISLMVFLSSCGKKIEIINLPPYLQTICFNNIVKPDDMDDGVFQALLGRYERKTYIPIVSFPAYARLSNIKDSVLTTIETLISKQVNIPGNILNGIKYMLGEMVDNITEHSESERGYVFAQSYSTKHYLDICIADKGITLFGSYANAGIEMSSDIEAMQAANKGVSSKNLPDAENRGYGIYTSKKMLIEGLQGQYMMMSGSAIYLKKREFDRILELPGGMRWNGTIIALRIPYQNQDFQYNRYFE